MKFNIKFLSSLLIAIFLFFTLGITAHEKHEETTRSQHETVRVLMIGNSFSKNASRYLPDLADEAGLPLVLDIAGIGGASMKKHWDLVQLAEKEPQNPDGKPYNGKSLKEALLKEKWDIVSIQQVSTQSGDAGTYRPYARQLYNLIKKIQPESQVVIHKTWPYRMDSNDWTQIAGGEHAKSNKEMWQNLNKAYNTIASELEVKVVPVGDAFWKVSSHKKWGYKKDPSFDESKAIFLDLPIQKYSLHTGYHWDDQKQLRFDSHHANNAGCFLGALVWYAFLFDESPRKLDFTPEGVSENFAKYLKTVAWSVAKN